MDPSAPAASAFAEALAAYAPLEQPRPLHESRIWSLNRRYWQQRGPLAFLRDAVPYHATNDGTLSAATADLMIAWMRSDAAPVAPPPRLVLLEVGPGSGLFARMTALHYARARSREPTLPALHYLGIDASAAMLEAIRERGLLDIDGVSARLLVHDLGVDAGGLGALLAAEIAPGTPVFAVTNYLLDSLPASLFRRAQGRVFEVLIDLRAATDAAAGLDSATLVARQQPVDCDQDDPIVRLAARFLQQDGEQVAINRTALRLIAALAGVIGANGCILIQDYTADVQAADAMPWQHFGGSIAIGLHLPSVEAFVAEALGWDVCAPDRPSASLISRMLLACPSPVLRRDYARLFSHDAARRAHTLAATARQARHEGRLGDALCQYEAAVAAEPENWSLGTEAAGFLLNDLRKPAAAERLARLAVEINPLDAPAWNLLGDCAYQRRDLAAASAAYEHANLVAGGDARALLNLAYCSSMHQRLDEALLWIAQALAVDGNGSLTPEILRRQGEILAQLPGREPAATGSAD